MLYHRIYRGLKKVMPAGMAGGIRAAATAVLTPFHFSRDTGHFRSAIRAKAVDPQGQPLPWYSYPMIDFLSRKSFKGCTILEFGAGQSTLWWSQRADRVTALEGDASWVQELVGRLKHGSAVDVHLVSDRLEGVDELLQETCYDIIVVDGLNRLAAAEHAARRLKDGGAVIVDNSEGFWGAEGSYPIMDTYRSSGFSRIDFYGHAPGVFLKQCTSLFFRDSCFLFHGDENPTIP